MSNLVLLGLTSLSEAIDSVGVYLAALVYKGVALVFKVFLILANGKLVDSSQYATLITNFYVIIGVVMLFILAFALLRGMINPDDKKQGTETVKKVILNLVTSTLIMAVLPTIFAFAFDFQNSVLIRQNTIGKFFGYGGNNGVDLAVEQGANQMANGVFTAFFNVNQQACDAGDSMTDCQKKVTDNDDERTFYDVMEEVNATGQFTLYNSFSEKIGNDNEIDHNWIFNMVAGVFIGYVAISFCFDMAVRLIKLIFYQLIAPVPVFLRVVPNGKLSGTFNQWLKVTVTCYLEVFIRILIFYFCVYLFNSLFGSNGYGANMHFLDGATYGVGLYVKAFVIMGIILFMKQAPKLLSEITGIDSGNMKLGIKDKLKDAGAFALPNAVGSYIASNKAIGDNPRVNNWQRFRQNMSNATKGFKHGWKNANFEGIGNAYARGYEYSEAKSARASELQIWADTYRRKLGLPTWVEMEDKRIERSRQRVTNEAGVDINYSYNGEARTLRTGESRTLTFEEQEALGTRRAELEDQVINTRNAIKKIEGEVKDRGILSSVVGTLEDTAFTDMEKKGKGRGIHYGVAKKVTTVNDENGTHFLIENQTDEHGELGTSEIRVGESVRLKNGQDYEISRIDNGRAYYRDANGKERVLADEEFFDGSYTSFLKSYEKLTPDMMERINIEETKLENAKNYIQGQIEDKDNNDIKNVVAQSYDKLAKAGSIDYEQYVINDDGSYKVNPETGQREVKKGSVKVEYDRARQKYVVTNTSVENGVEVVKELSGNDYDVFDALKKIGKEDARVKNDRVASYRGSIDTQEKEIEAIDMVNSAMEKSRAKEKTSPRYKAGKASSNISKSNKN